VFKAVLMLLYRVKSCQGWCDVQGKIRAYSKKSAVRREQRHRPTDMWSGNMGRSRMSSATPSLESLMLGMSLCHSQTESYPSSNYPYLSN